VALNGHPLQAEAVPHACRRDHRSIRLALDPAQAQECSEIRSLGVGGILEPLAVDPAVDDPSKNTRQGHRQPRPRHGRGLDASPLLGAQGADGRHKPILPGLQLKSGAGSSQTLLQASQRQPSALQRPAQPSREVFGLGSPLKLAQRSLDADVIIGRGSGDRLVIAVGRQPQTRHPRGAKVG